MDRNSSERNLRGVAVYWLLAFVSLVSATLFLWSDVFVAVEDLPPDLDRATLAGFMAGGLSAVAGGFALVGIRELTGAGRPHDIAVVAVPLVAVIITSVIAGLWGVALISACGAVALHFVRRLLV